MLWGAGSHFLVNLQQVRLVMLCNAVHPHLFHSSQMLCVFWHLFQILLLLEIIRCKKALCFRFVFSDSKLHDSQIEIVSNFKSVKIVKSQHTSELCVYLIIPIFWLISHSHLLSTKKCCGYEWGQMYYVYYSLLILWLLVAILSSPVKQQTEGSVGSHGHGNVRNAAISSFAPKQKELLKRLACPTSHNKAGAPRSQSVLC